MKYIKNKTFTLRLHGASVLRPLSNAINMILFAWRNSISWLIGSDSGAVSRLADRSCCIIQSGPECTPLQITVISTNKCARRRRNCLGMCALSILDYENLVRKQACITRCHPLGLDVICACRRIKSLQFLDINFTFKSQIARITKQEAATQDSTVYSKTPREKERKAIYIALF